MPLPYLQLGSCKQLTYTIIIPLSYHYHTIIQTVTVLPKSYSESTLVCPIPFICMKVGTK